MYRLGVLFCGVVTGIMLSVAFAPMSIAQISSEGNGISSESVNPLAELQRRLSQSALASTMPPMEGAVDPDGYVVGPGDHFSVSINGRAVSGERIVVGADGTLPVHDTGLVTVGGQTLTEARRTLIDAIRRTHTNATIDIALTSPRQFYVHVSGSVPRPGRFLALPVSRVSSVLDVAFSDTLQTPTQNYSLRPSLRNIRVVHRDGSEGRADLVRYYSCGDREANPFLRDGDVIFITSYDPSYAGVYIGGAVPFPGPYDYRRGDTVSDLICLGGGLPEQSNSTTIRVTRVSPDGSSSHENYAIDDIVNGDAGSIPLQARDHVQVIPMDRDLGTATVEGMVTHPGSYPIREGETTVRSLVELSGGLQRDALARGAYIERASLPEPVPPVGNRLDNRMLNPDIVLRTDSTEILRQLRLSSLDFLSRTYYAQELRLQNRVSLDLPAVLAGTSGDVVLRHGDRLVIPRDPNSVHVFGQVRRAGWVEYVEGRDADYYIAAAGGRGEHSEKVYLVHPASGAFSVFSGQEIQSGDRIFVDRTTDIADNPELQRLVLEEERARKDAQIRTFQVIAQGISTIATVVALAVSILRN